MNFKEKELRLFNFSFKVGKVIESEQVTIQDEDGDDVTLQSFQLQGKFTQGAELTTVSPDPKYLGIAQNVLLSVKNKTLERKFTNPTTGRKEIEVLEPKFFVGEYLEITARLSYYLDENTGEVRPSLRAVNMLLSDKEDSRGVVIPENITTFANVAEAQKAGLLPVEEIATTGNGSSNTTDGNGYFERLVAFSGQTQTQLETLKATDAAAYKIAVDGFIASLPKAAKTAAIAELA